MQVPERLALIGGSILLASTLIFTLKSQASSIVPNVGHSISSIYDHISDAQPKNFDENYQQAQKKGWQTGNWGSSKFYIDDGMNMHIGAGQLQGKLYDIVGGQAAYRIRTINLDEDAKAPQDSDNLFTGLNYHNGNGLNEYTNQSIVAINGLGRLDTSQVVHIGDMFYHDNALSNDLDIGNWNTSNVTEMAGIFGQTNLSHLNIKNWDVHNVHDLSWAFTGVPSLTNVDLSGWHTDNLQYADSMFSTNDASLTNLNLGNFDTTHTISNKYFLGGSADWDTTPNQLSKITLGDKAQLRTTTGLSGTWKNGNQTLNGSDLTSAGINGNPSHPGTWTKQ